MDCINFSFNSLCLMSISVKIADSIFLLRFKSNTSGICIYIEDT